MRGLEVSEAFSHGQDQLSSRDLLDAFYQRQQVDLRRFGRETTPIIRRIPFHDRQDSITGEGENQSQQLPWADGISNGEEAWRDREGDRLDDFGVDESVEFYDEDDLPLATLLRKQRNRNQSSDRANTKAKEL